MLVVSRALTQMTQLYSRCYGNGRFLNPWGLVLQSLHRKYSTTSPAIHGEKRANWNWSGRSTIEIRVRLFEQQAIFRVDFLVAENVENSSIHGGWIIHISDSLNWVYSLAPEILMLHQLMHHLHLKLIHSKLIDQTMLLLLTTQHCYCVISWSNLKT